MLTVEQAAHRDEIVDMASDAIFKKYTIGAMEHNTNLKEETTIEQLLDFAIEEAIDQMVYLLTLKQKLGDPREATGTRE